MTSEASATTVAPFTAREMMAIAAGRFIRDGDILFAGTGVAMLAAAVAKRVHAPKAVVFFETGGIPRGPLRRWTCSLVALHREPIARQLLQFLH